MQKNSGNEKINIRGKTNGEIILIQIKIIFLLLFLMFGILMFHSQTIFASQIGYSESAINVPKEADEYVSDNYYSMVLVSEDEYDLDRDIEESLCTLGNPFIIIGSDMGACLEKYYYPVLIEGNITFIISVIGTTDGWSLCLSQEFVDDLKRFDYLDNSCNVFKLKGNEIIPDTGLTRDEVNDFIEEMIPMDCSKNEILSNNKNFKETYSPSYSFNVTSGSDVGKIFSLHNKKGQGNLPICWAASVATIVNYRKGSNLSAKDVCDKMKTGYNGASIDTKLNALHEYGLTAYKKQVSSMSWKTIIKNIDEKRPIAMSTFSTNSGHAVTLIGYRFRNGTKYVVLWNSGNKQVQTVTYPSTGKVSYSYNNTTWVWKQSLARYID